MSLSDKSAIAMTATLTVVYGGYAVLLARRLSDAPATEVAWVGLLVAAVVALVALAAVTHAVIAVTTPADVDDERDPPDRSLSQRVGQAILAAGTVAGLGLAIAGASSFWIAQTLLGGLVLGEIASGVTGLLASRS